MTIYNNFKIITKRNHNIIIASFMSKVIINCIAKSIICRETDSREFDYRQSRTESYGILMA